MHHFKVKFEIRTSGEIRTDTVVASDPQSAAQKVRDKYKNQQIVVVTVKAAKAPVAA